MLWHGVTPIDVKQMSIIWQ